MLTRVICYLSLAGLLAVSLGCWGPTVDDSNVLRVAMPTTGPKTVDPVRGSTVYENRAASLVYETLLQYKYLVRPPELEPLLLAEMPRREEVTIIDPETGEEVTTAKYHFKLKQGVHFHNDPCFPDGKGREMVAGDVIYSWKRMANLENDPQAWWLFKDTILGFDEYRDEQNARVKQGGEFDYEASVAGFQILGDHEFTVTLKEPVYRFLYVLAMFQTAVVPREAVEKYGDEFGIHPVGTGPFTLSPEDFELNVKMTFHRNPDYHGVYPTEHMPEDIEAGLAADAGKQLPFLDGIEITMYPNEQPMWLEFKEGKLDMTAVPYKFFSDAFVKRTRTLRDEFVAQGLQDYQYLTLDFIFRGFNMEDELLGGYSEEKKALRQAIHLAVNLEEMNEAFYEETLINYDGPIPPGLEGHPKNHTAPTSFRGPDLQRARELLAKAGYPDGEGLPEISYYTGKSDTSKEMAEMLKRQLSKIGVKLKPVLSDFPTLMDTINKKQAPFFGFAWKSDYPDAENNLALFYGPNESPGANHYNYKREEYDDLYRRIRTMPPSPERTELYVKMRDMIIEDCPYVGSSARRAFVLVRPWLMNYKPTDVFDNWYKYLRLEPRSPSR